MGAWNEVCDEPPPFSGIPKFGFGVPNDVSV
jgi:hypothetical protein